MKKIIAFGFFAILAGAILLVRPIYVRAAIEAVYDFVFAQSTVDNVPIADTAIDRSTGTVYVLSDEGIVRVFDDEGNLVRSFEAATVQDEIFDGIAVDPLSKNVFLTSSEGAVKVFDSEGVYVESYGAAALSGAMPLYIAADENGSYLTDENNSTLYFFDRDHTLIETLSVANAYYVEAQNGTVYTTSGGDVSTFSSAGIPGDTIDIMVSHSEGFAVQPGGTGFVFTFNTRDGSTVLFTDEEGNDDGQFGDSFRNLRSVELKSEGTLIVAQNTGDAGNIRAYNTTDPDNIELSYYIPSENPGVIMVNHGMTTDADDSIFIADYESSLIKKYTSEGEFLDSFGASGSANGEFSNLSDIALDDDGNIYVADTGNGRIQVLDGSGNYIRQWAVTEDGSYEGPRWIGVLDDKVYVAGPGGDEHLIQVFSLEGTPLFTFGGPDAEIEGQFNEITAFTAGDDEKLYVFDTYDNIISVFNPDGSFVERFNEFTVDGTPQTIDFDSVDLAVDRHGNIFLLADSSRILILNAAHEQIGEVGSAGNGEGEFSDLKSIAVTNSAIYAGEAFRTQVFSYTDDVEYDDENEGEQEEETPTPERSGSSGGSSVSVRFNNLMNSGNLAAAQELLKQYPGLITPNPLTLPIRDLKFGSSGEDVKQLQQLLILKGYPIPAGATGLFWTQTRAALAAYQKANNIKPSAGYFGPITRAQMKAAGLTGLWW